MSKAFCCDRCGKLYKGNGMTAIITDKTLNSYDLCSDCSEELISWLRNEVYFVGHREAADDQQGEI